MMFEGIHKSRPPKKTKNGINMSHLIKKKEKGQYSYGGDGLLKVLKTL